MFLYFLAKQNRLLIKEIANDNEYSFTYLSVDFCFKKSILKIENNNVKYGREKIVTQKSILQLLPYYNILTSKLIKCGVHRDRMWIMLGFIDGCKLTEVNYKIYNSFVDLLTKIHSIYLKGFGYISTTKGELSGIFSKWNDYLVGRFEYNIEFLENFLPISKINKIKSIFYNRVDNINIKRGVLIHNDIKTDNLIFNQDTQQLYILDWEESIIGDPLFEYAGILNKIKNNQLSPLLKMKWWDNDETVKFYRMCLIIYDIGWIIRHVPENVNKSNLLNNKFKYLLELI